LGNVDFAHMSLLYKKPRKCQANYTALPRTSLSKLSRSVS
jgi:hypothetical protein